MKTAFLLVDLQLDFLQARPLIPVADVVVARAASLLRACRDAGVPVIHVRLTIDRKLDNRMPHWKEAGKWLCVDGTEGNEAPAGLAAAAGEKVIRKSFFSAFTNPGLQNHLEELGVDTILLAGVYQHSCVRATAIDAYQRGYRVAIAEEAVAGPEPLQAAATRSYLVEKGIRFLSPGGSRALIRGDEFALATDHQMRSAAAVENAAEDAHAAAMTWRESSLAQRIDLLKSLASELARRREDLAREIVAAVGKPLCLARAEIDRSRELLEAATRPEVMPANGISFSDGSRGRRVPHGVVAAVTPWNHPLALALGKIAPAVFHGNAVLWKASPYAAGPAASLCRIMRTAGWPPGLVSLVQGGGDSARQVMRDPRVRAVSITGGPLAGSAAAEICASRFVPLQAELGGNNAAVVWPDADLDEAAASIAAAAFAYAGQRCTATRRAIIPKAGVENFLARLADATTRLPWGDPADENTMIGPVLSEERRADIAAVVEGARARGNTVITPHDRVPTEPDSAWYPPTIVSCRDPADPIARQETFGPVVAVLAASDWDNAIDLCNEVDQGLVAALFSNDTIRQQDFLRRAECGVLKINEATADVGVEAPFGGWKESGAGPPEHGPSNVEFYTRWQSIYGFPSA